jgi:phage-related protein
MGHIITRLVERNRAAQSSTRGDKLARLKIQSQSGEPNHMADAKVLSNQKTILANQATIVKNQKAILSNQKTMVKNQKALLANQGTIKKNQSALSEILNNQKEILAAVKK